MSQIEPNLNFLDFPPVISAFRKYFRHSQILGGGLVYRCCFSIEVSIVHSKNGLSESFWWYFLERIVVLVFTIWCWRQRWVTGRFYKLCSISFIFIFASIVCQINLFQFSNRFHLFFSIQICHKLMWSDSIAFDAAAAHSLIWLSILIKLQLAWTICFPFFIHHMKRY